MEVRLLHQILRREEISRRRQRLTELLEADARALQRYSEYKAAFERLNTPEVAALFAELDAIRERVELLEAIKERLDRVSVELATLAEEAGAAPAADLLDEASEELSRWWSEMAPRLELEDLPDSLTAALQAAADELRRRTAAVDAEVDAQRRLADEKEAELRDRTQADPGASIRREQREESRRRFQTADQNRRRYEATLNELRGLLAARAEIVRRLSETAASIAAARRTTAEQLTERLAGIGEGDSEIAITVDAGQDRADFVEHLESTFLNRQRGGHYRERQLARRLGRHAPSTLTRAILARRAEDLATGDGDAEVTSEEAARLVGAFEIFAREESAEVEVVDAALDELLRLEELPVDDLVLILLDRQPVDERSPGQRSSAMLPLVAIADPAPLIIDQPEDNLDNRMVGRTLTSILAELKERRQIIVTTHNPNIVVGGDAEQVVVLDAPTSRSAARGADGQHRCRRHHRCRNQDHGGRQGGVRGAPAALRAADRALIQASESSPAAAWARGVPAHIRAPSRSSIPPIGGQPER